ncbi:ring-h2 finger protein [Nannochloropsis oceanica]
MEELFNGIFGGGRRGEGRGDGRGHGERGRGRGGYGNNGERREGGASGGEQGPSRGREGAAGVRGGGGRGVAGAAGAVGAGAGAGGFGGYFPFAGLNGGGDPSPNMSQFVANMMAMHAGMHMSQHGMPTQQYDQDGWELPPQEWLRQNHERRVGPPPASTRVLRRLPDVTVTEADVQSDKNKEGCTVCLEPHIVGSKALKLPCQHLFHRSCVMGWLEQHCTCPVCRFELETEDVEYETERKKRMKSRRIRLRPGELKGKSTIELKRLCESIGISTHGCLEKGDLIRRLEESGVMDVVGEEEGKEGGKEGGREGGEESVDNRGGGSTNSVQGGIGTSSTAFSSSPAPRPSSSSSMLSVSELRRLMAQLSVSSFGCLEKGDMLSALRESGKLPPGY